MTAASAAIHITSAMSSKKLCVTKSVGSRAPNMMGFCRLSFARGLRQIREVYIKSKNGRCACAAPRPASRSCPLWVISGHSATSERCLLYLRKQTSLNAVVMSAKCQQRTSAYLLDQLVGSDLQPRRNREVQCLSGLQVDYELKLGWRLNRQICGSGALEYLVHVVGRPSENS